MPVSFTSSLSINQSSSGAASPTSSGGFDQLPSGHVTTPGLAGRRRRGPSCLRSSPLRLRNATLGPQLQM